MGYTHYWYRPEVIAPAEWRAFVKDAEKIIAASPVPLAPISHVGSNLHEFTKLSLGQVRTNGAEPDDYETFLVERITRRTFNAKGDLVFEFCKTEHRPYDVVVVALLCALKARVPATIIKSDGKPRDLELGIALYETVIGTPAPAWNDKTEPVGLT